MPDHQLFTVEVNVTIDADSADDARMRVVRMIGDGCDYSTGNIWNEGGELIEEVN